jgi:hypothetical protein
MQCKTNIVGAETVDSIKDVHMHMHMLVIFHQQPDLK